MTFTERLVIPVIEDIVEGYNPAKHSKFTNMYLASTTSDVLHDDKICSDGISVSLETMLKTALKASDLYIIFN